MKGKGTSAKLGERDEVQFAHADSFARFPK